MEISMSEYSTSDDKNKTMDELQEQIYIGEIIRAVLNWKYYIIAVTVLIGIIAATISINSEKIYEVETIIKPGIMNIGPEGDVDYTENPVNIRELINSSSFKKRLLEYIKQNEKKMNLPGRLNFRITVGRGRDATIGIIKETTNIEQGIHILKYLIRYLELQYEEVLIENKERLANQLARTLTQLRELEISKKIHQEYIEFYKQRTKELIAEIEQINNTTSTITDTGPKALPRDNKNEDLLLKNFFYINAIQQSRALISAHESQIKQYEIKTRESMEMISFINQQIQDASKDIDELSIKTEKLKSIITIQQPYGIKIPIRPKVILNIIVASVCGFLLAVLCAVFLEVVYKKK